MGRPDDAASWTAAARVASRPTTRAVELRYRDPTRMGKVYLVPQGVERVRSPAGTSMGPDADDPALDLATWRERIRKHRGELKNLLKKQAFVAGIGNGYSDEILWEARLAPFRKRSSLAADEVDALYAGDAGACSRWAIDELRERVPPRFEVEVRDFLRVHRKGGDTLSALRHHDQRDLPGRVRDELVPDLPALTRSPSHGAAGQSPRRVRDPGLRRDEDALADDQRAD